MFHLLKVRAGIDIFSTEKCNITFGLRYTCESIHLVDCRQCLIHIASELDPASC